MQRERKAVKARTGSRQVLSSWSDGRSGEFYFFLDWDEEKLAEGVPEKETDARGADSANESKSAAFFLRE